MIIKKGVLGEIIGFSSSPKYDVEYEEIVRKLKDNTNKKYNKPIDKRFEKKVPVFMNQLVEYETNMFNVYPQENPQYQESGSWIGGYDDK